MSVTVVEFPTQPKFSLPQTLRDLADRYESGEYEAPDTFAYVTESEDGVSWGLVGDADYIRASALFNMASDNARQEAME